MMLELFIGLIVVSVIVYGVWALLSVFRFSIPEHEDVELEVERESEWLRAVSRAARR